MVDDNPALSFEAVQQRVRFHYQYVVLNDFLPRIVTRSVLERPQDRRPLRPGQAPVLPLEERPVHAGGVLRGGLSPGPFDDPAGLSAERRRHMLLPIFPIRNHPDLPDGLTGFRAMNPALGHRLGTLHRRRHPRLRRRRHGGQEAAPPVRLPHRHLAGEPASRICRRGRRRIRPRWRSATCCAAGASAFRVGRAWPSDARHAARGQRHLDRPRC